MSASLRSTPFGEMTKEVVLASINIMAMVWKRIIFVNTVVDTVVVVVLAVKVSKSDWAGFFGTPSEGHPETAWCVAGRTKTH